MDRLDRAHRVAVRTEDANALRTTWSADTRMTILSVPGKGCVSLCLREPYFLWGVRWPVSVTCALCVSCVTHVS